MRHLVVCLLVALTLAGCAARRAPAVVSPAVQVRPRSSVLETAESRAPGLAEAVARARAFPTADNHLRAAQGYLEAGIADQAFVHFERASKLDPRNAAAWDGMARIWRDWGFPALALPDAYRAVAFAPGAAAPHNTLGTVLQSLGHGPAARAEFERALRIDAGAAYALGNLCYSWLKDARPDEAAGACRAALPGAPDGRH